MDIERISAFAQNGQGGNPAGVVIGSALPAPADMQRVAREVGYSETAFAAPVGKAWVVRYFSPEAEVPFCGHATIALGYALARRFGPGRYDLTLAQAKIAVTAEDQSGDWLITLNSPPTWSRPLSAPLLAELFPLFHLTSADLDPALAPRIAHAGASHAVLALGRREVLAAMAYEFEPVKAVMLREGLTTISLIFRKDEDHFITRNAFAVGGVVEDPATGAAAAALGGMLVDLGRGAGRFFIRQGEEMGMPSLLQVQVSGVPGDSVQVSGAARLVRVALSAP